MTFNAVCVDSFIICLLPYGLMNLCLIERNWLILT